MSQRDCSRCTALTKQGTQCSRTTCKYSHMCFQHSKSALGLQVKTSHIPNTGQGLYTTKTIKRGQKVASYGGNVVSQNAYNQNPSGYGIHLNNNQVLDGKSTQSGLGRYANTCKPANKRQGQCKGQNAKLSVNHRNQSASLKATKKIKAGEEVYVPYGNNFW